MKIKVNDTTPLQLNWLVAKCEGALSPLGNVVLKGNGRLIIAVGEIEEPIVVYSPSADWAQGGPLIEREEIDIYCYTSPKNVPEAGLWAAEITGTNHKKRGPTPLIAAMRCLVASKMGDEVEIPKELV